MIKLIVTLLLITPSTFAEYRAFSLLITHQEKQTTRAITSTMDHIQYPQYYPLNPGETIELVDSWMCWGNTSHFKKTCANPRALEGFDALQ